MDYIVDSDGKKRRAISLVCANCNVTFLRAKNRITLHRNVFCNPECKHASGRVKLNCDLCEKPFVKRKSAKGKFNFCSRKCKDNAQKIQSGSQFSEMRPNHYRNGISAYREWALKEFDSACARCGYSMFPDALVVHHIDRNRNNNTLGNLEILCRNCHYMEHLPELKGE
jgi:hypothetical protein